MSTTVVPPARTGVRPDRPGGLSIPRPAAARSGIPRPRVTPSEVPRPGVPRSGVPRSGVPRPGVQPRGRRPVRLTRRGRVVVVGLLLSLALTASFAVLREASVATDRPGDVRYRTVTVSPGETLWDIARAAAPEADPRDTVKRIIDFNALPTAVVQPGQQIAVPDSVHR